MRLCSRICLILCSCRIRITKQLDVQSEQEEESETQRRPSSRYKSKQIRKGQTESHKEELEEKVYSINISIAIEYVGHLMGSSTRKTKMVSLLSLQQEGHLILLKQCKLVGARQILKFWCNIYPSVYFLLQLSILPYHTDQWKLVGANLNSNLF